MFLTNTACLLGFLVQMVFVVYHLLHPLPVTTIQEIQLADLEFPIVFKLCAHVMWEDNLRYQEVGYTDEEEMYLGRSKYDPNQFGWSGHSENGSLHNVSGNEYGCWWWRVHLSSLEILRRTNVPWSSIIQSVEVEGGGELSGEQISWQTVQHYSHCAVLDISLLFTPFKTRGFSTVNINIRKTEKIGVTIFIEDKEEVVSRAIKSNLQVYTGAKISLSNANSTWDKKFILRKAEIKIAGNL